MSDHETVVMPGGYNPATDTIQMLRLADVTGVMVSALKLTADPDAPVVYVDGLLKAIRIIIREELERAK